MLHPFIMPTQLLLLVLLRLLLPCICLLWLQELLKVQLALMLLAMLAALSAAAEAGAATDLLHSNTLLL
jgi:hypothetical protein